jgi:hypothetical protein
MGSYMPGARDVEEEPEEEEMELDMAMGGADDADMAPDMDMGDEMGDEMGAEMGDEMGDELGGGESKMIAVDDFMGALEAALEDVLGEPVSTEMDMEDEEGPVDLEAPEDEMGDVGAEMGAEEEEEEEEEALPPMMEKEDMVAEIARRVVARLQEQKSKQDLVDTLAERIMKRLTK